MSGCYPLGFFKESSRETPLFVPKNDKTAKSCAFFKYCQKSFYREFSKNPCNALCHCEERSDVAISRKGHRIMKTYYVYIMTNVDNTVLYTGVTDDIERRVAEHKSHTLKGFTDRYNVTKCVYVEEYGNINDAIMREKQIKGWSRARKFDLINTTNPVLKDLGE